MPPDQQPFDVTALIERERATLLDDAAGALERSHLAHYDEVGTAERRRRLEALLDIVTTCLRERDLVPMHRYAEEIANDRFAAGFDVAEVQTAFNVLEEAVWRCVVAQTPPEDLADAIGPVATVLGVGKDSLARTYVALATKHHVPSLDLTALFRGGR